MQNADFKTPYRTHTGTRPLGHATLLATEITLTPGTDQQVSIHFTVQLDSNNASRTLQLALQAPLVFSLLQMLGQALKHTQWLSVADVAGLLVDDAILPDMDRPRYLS